MTFIDCEELPKSPSIQCRFFPCSLKDAFARCYAFPMGKQSASSLEDENPPSDIEDERVIILAIRRRAMKARLQRRENLMAESLCWVVSPVTKEVFIPPKGEIDAEHKEADEDGDAFFSAKSSFSRSSAANGVDYLWRRSVFEEFCHLDGWPFGLYKKMMLLPPLPRSPSESWSWRRANQLVRMY